MVAQAAERENTAISAAPKWVSGRSILQEQDPRKNRAGARATALASDGTSRAKVMSSTEVSKVPMVVTGCGMPMLRTALPWKVTRVDPNVGILHLCLESK